jgi:hypothetical protein
LPGEPKWVPCRTPSGFRLQKNMKVDSNLNSPKIV